MLAMSVYLNGGLCYYLYLHSIISVSSTFIEHSVTRCIVRYGTVRYGTVRYSTV